jgi:membrane protein
MAAAQTGVWRRQWERCLAWPAVAHLRRAAERYRDRLGSEAGAAMAYFSLLILLPTLMVLCAVLGLFVTVIRPEWLGTVQSWLEQVVGDLKVSGQIMDQLTRVLGNWRSIGLAALVLAVYSGANWVSHLKRALDTIGRPPEAPWQREPQPNFFRGLLRNAWLFALLATLVLVTVTLALVPDIGPALGFEHALLRLLAVAGSLVLGWILFVVLLRVVPTRPRPWADVVRGALLGTIGLGCFHLLASVIIRAFAHNQTAVLFGPIIVLVLILNLIAQFLFFTAASTATADPAEKNNVTEEPSPVTGG